MEYNAHAAANCGDRGRKEMSVEMDHVATTWTVTRTAKRRKERSAPVQGASEEVRVVEAEGHDGTREGLENGSGGGGEAVVQA